ncbi:MAG: hypothetical protein D3906_02710 [Candidatus Electrothrix sp. AUS1_2]|nr:hypothetical protein [Candidatus Electrothrix sp. AUS1_2]
MQNGNFLGFGAEWDTPGYVESRVTDEDFRTITKRIEWMRLPLVRVMMQSRWCYKGNGNFNWNSKEMLALYRILSICKEQNITVYLTDWGVERKGLRVPEVHDCADEKYNRVIIIYLQYLLEDKGFFNIKKFIFGNEANHEVGSWKRWRKGFEKFVEEFKHTELAEKIAIIGSDTSDPMWHIKTVQQLNKFVDMYSIHKYVKKRDILNGDFFDNLKIYWNHTRQHEFKELPPPVVITEAGIRDGARPPNGNKKIDTFEYGLLMADYAIQALNAGTNAVFAWMLDDNSHSNFYWGMWKNKKNKLSLRPWFYSWALLTRFIQPNSTIYNVKVLRDNVRILASSTMRDGKIYWNICLVNHGDKFILNLNIKNGTIVKFDKYLYGSDNTLKNKDGFPLPVEKFLINSDTGGEVLIEGNSFIFLTSEVKNFI